MDTLLDLATMNQPMPFQWPALRLRSLTLFLHLLLELQTPTSEDVWAHGHGEDVIREFSTSVKILHLVVVKLLEGFVRRDDLVEQTT